MKIIYERDGKKFVSLECEVSVAPAGLRQYAGVTVAELVQLLQTFPQDCRVCYRDGNFGGPGDDFTPSDVSIENGIVLIRSPYRDDVSGP